MKQLIQLAAGMVALLAMQGAAAGTIGDSFIGNDAHGGKYGDSIGGSTYDISGASVTRIGSVLTVVINTNFAGNAGGNPSIGYGDLFLSNVWNPAGPSDNGAYKSSDATAGTVWKYALHIDDTKRTSNTGDALTLYELKGETNAANIWNSDYYLADTCNPVGKPVACEYRNKQAAGVNLTPGNTNVAKVNTTTTDQNKWAVNGAAHTVTFTMDVSGTALMNYSSFAIHWGETCQNDMIEGQVPEPATLALLAVGLCGIMTLRRRRKS